MIAIQWEDVIGVLQTCAPYLIALAVLWVIAVIVMIACRKAKKSRKRMIRKYSGLSMVLTLVVVLNLICLGPMSALINLTMGSGQVSDSTTDEAIEVADQIAEEGMVLLENDGILPISEPSNINLFGWSSVNPTYGGTGSAAGVYRGKPPPGVLPPQRRRGLSLYPGGAERHAGRPVPLSIF